MSKGGAAYLPRLKLAENRGNTKQLERRALLGGKQRHKCDGGGHVYRKDGRGGRRHLVAC